LRCGIKNTYKFRSNTFLTFIFKVTSASFSPLSTASPGAPVQSTGPFGGQVQFPLAWGVDATWMWIPCPLPLLLALLATEFA